MEIEPVEYIKEIHYDMAQGKLESILMLSS